MIENKRPVYIDTKLHSKIKSEAAKRGIKFNEYIALLLKKVVK